MNRRTRTVIVIAIAVLCATVASVSVLVAIRRIDPVEVLEPQSPVVVAARPVSMGIRLGEDDVKVAQWPTRMRVPGAYTDVKGVLNRGLIASVVENEPLTDQKMAPLAAGGGLPPAIHPGMRAISVKVNEVIGVAGFVVPGARVDVLVTIRQSSESTSRIVVSNVQVLTAGTGFDQDKGKDGKPMPATVVTLMVSPSDAERIALAAAEGQILLTLRNPLDTVETRTPGIRTAGLLSVTPSAPTPIGAPTASASVPTRRTPVAKQATATPAAAPPTVAPAAYAVESIRAAKRTQEVIR